MSSNGHGRLLDKVAIVTGASSGIGKAIALTFSAEGADVVCADIQEFHEQEETDMEGELSTHHWIEQNGGNALFIRTDVSQSGDMQNLINTTIQEFGQLDIFVNSAGISHESSDPQPIWQTSEETWDSHQRVDARGVFLGCKYASAQMIQQEPHENGDRGWIINISSVLGSVGQEKSASSCAAKAAVEGVTKAAALDCAPYRIHVNAICPGYTATPMTEALFRNPRVQQQLLNRHPFRGIGIPDDIARAALFLATEDSSWVSGVCLPVDGGYLAQ